MASGGSPSLISLYTSSARDLQSLEGIGPKRAEKIVELRSRGAFTMAELVVASGKPCVEWRGLFSVGRVEPLEEEGSMLSTPPEPPAPAEPPSPLPPRLRLTSLPWRRTSGNISRGSPSRFSGRCPRSVGQSRIWIVVLSRSVGQSRTWTTK